MAESGRPVAARRLHAALKFPDVMHTHNATVTGEEAFLYMLRRLAYPSTQAMLAMECQPKSAGVSILARERRRQHATKAPRPLR